MIGAGVRKVRLADFHVNDVTPLLFQLARAGQQFHDVKRGDIGRREAVKRHREAPSDKTGEFTQISQKPTQIAPASPQKTLL